jgi:hypothetical protein
VVFLVAIHNPTMVVEPQQPLRGPEPAVPQPNSGRGNNDALAQRVDVVSDSLLALAKDARYVKEFQSLFLQVMSLFLPRRRHQLLVHESWILASLLCFALGLKHTSKGTTLGMETVGLQFPTRAARWKFVAAVMTTLSWAYAFSPDRTAASDAANRDGHRLRDSSRYSSSNEEPQHNEEMLRGNRRRQFHEAQRQAMLRRASEAAGNQNSPSSTSTSESQGAISSPNIQTSAQTVRSSIRQRIKIIFYQLAQVCLGCLRVTRFKSV